MIKTPLSTVIGGAFWTPGCTVIGGNTPTFDQQILKLFANGEQGFWYDPNDLSTMFQDAMGTVPITGAGQPVGLVLDKSTGFALGANKATTSSVQGVAIGGAGLTTYRIADNLVVGKFYKVDITISGYEGTDTVGVAGTASDAFYLASGDLRLKSGNTKISFIAKATNPTQHLATRSTNTAIFEDIQIKELVGNHAYQTTSASRPILRQNAVTGANYLEFDGTDDFLQTNNIDFTATDKMSVFAGVRKLSDATSALLCELTDGSNAQLSVFSLFAPAGSGLYKYDFRNALGSIGATTTDVKYSAPVSSVVTGKITSKDVIKAALRLNGLAISTISNGMSTKLANAPLYIGRRGGTSLPFNGHLYSLIGIGRLTSDSETKALEKAIAKVTGVTLNV